MKFEKFVVPPLNNNAYLVWDEKTNEAIVIDPAQGSDKILEFAIEKNLNIRAIVNTHYHFDHVFENAKLRKKTNAALMMHGKDIPYYEKDEMSEKMNKEKVEKTTVNAALRDTDIIRFGEQELTVIHTPGHTEGSVCLYSNKDGIMFTGDTLFAGTYGRVDLPGSDQNKMKETLARLADFPTGTKVYPGHGNDTTIEAELEWLKKFKK